MYGLCSSKPKYTHEETGCYVILRKVEMTLSLYTEMILMGWVGIDYCQLSWFKLRGRAYLYGLRSNLLWRGKMNNENWKQAKLNSTGWLSMDRSFLLILALFCCLSFPSCSFLPAPPVAKSSTNVLPITTTPLQRKMWSGWPSRSWLEWPSCIGTMWCTWIWK